MTKKNQLLIALDAFARSLQIGIMGYDLYTYLHHADVSTYIALLAEHYHFPQEEIRLIAITAAIHDVGKLGVLNTIIRTKTKKLDYDSPEMAQIRLHVEYGYRIVSTFLNTVSDSDRDKKIILDGIRFHHEQWSGRGYPHGLKQQEIPLVARIVGVADAISAMSMPERHWRPPMAIIEVIAELRRCAGSQFDPDIANIAANILEQGKVKITDFQPDEAKDFGINNNEK